MQIVKDILNGCNNVIRGLAQSFRSSLTTERRDPVVLDSIHNGISQRWPRRGRR
jgi:hypothetical protein